jgi:hypothetical protein
MRKRWFGRQRARRWLRRLLVSACVSSALACVELPLGWPGLHEMASPAATLHPVLFVGRSYPVIGPERGPVLAPVMRRAALRIPRALGPVADASLDRDARRALTRLAPGEPATYLEVAPELPDHYLVRFAITLDGSDLPQAVEAVDAARGHALWNLVWSWVPMHSLRVGVRCEVRLARVTAGREEPLERMAWEGDRRHLGNFWWLASSWEGTARRSFDALVDECIETIRDRSIARLNALEGVAAAP